MRTLADGTHPKIYLPSTSNMISCPILRTAHDEIEAEKYEKEYLEKLAKERGNADEEDGTDEEDGVDEEDDIDGVEDDEEDEAEMDVDDEDAEDKELEAMLMMDTKMETES